MWITIKGLNANYQAINNQSSHLNTALIVGYAFCNLATIYKGYVADTVKNINRLPAQQLLDDPAQNQDVRSIENAPAAIVQPVIINQEAVPNQIQHIDNEDPPNRDDDASIIESSVGDEFEVHDHPPRTRNPDDWYEYSQIHSGLLPSATINFYKPFGNKFINPREQSIGGYLKRHFQSLNA